MITAIKKGWRTFLAGIDRLDAFSWVGYPSLVIFLFYFGFAPEVQRWFVPIALLPFFWPRLLLFPGYWGVVTAFLSYDLYHSWITAANHTWVMWYWSVSLFAASFFSQESDRRFVIANNARWLLIIIMLVAVYWKAINPYYIDSSFFERNLVSNSLMTTFTHTFGVLPFEDILKNYEAQSAMFDAPEEKVIPVYTNQLVGVMAVFVTWWVLLIELVIGFLLLFYRPTADWWAHVFHMWFVAGAYFAVPILGFGFILVTLGSALTLVGHPKLRLWYVGLYILLALYILPWNYVLFQLLGLYPLW